MSDLDTLSLRTLLIVPDTIFHFDQTKSLFQRWLLYGIGTTFSLAVLYVMVILATDTVVAVAGAFWMTDLLDVSGKEGLKTIALQQGGLGLIMTMLLISVPPMAAAFFQGTLGNFMHYNAFESGRGGGRDGYRNSPGAAGPVGAPIADRSNDTGASNNRSPSINQGVSPGRLSGSERQLANDNQVRPFDTSRDIGVRNG